MRAGLAVVLALSVLLVAPSYVSGDIALPGSPKYANNMLGGFVTPTVSPGQTVFFSFNLTNPYDNESASMESAVLTVGIYKYATQEKAKDVNSSFKNPPSIDGQGTEISRDLVELQVDETERIELEIDTSKNTPHGSYFSQSTYFVRFKLTFHFPANTTQVLLQSRGFFTDEQWDHMVSFSGNESIVNTTYMHSLGVDGLLPDSSFGIKIPIPRWPLYLLIAVICGTAFMATYYFVLDNPGKYPRLEQRFYYLRGKLSELGSQLKDRRRK